MASFFQYLNVFRSRDLFYWLTAGFLFGLGLILAHLLWILFLSFFWFLKTLLIPIAIIALIFALFAIINPPAAQQTVSRVRGTFAAPFGRLWGYRSWIGKASRFRPTPPKDY